MKTNLVFFLLLVAASMSAQAQLYYGFQAIGVHTLFVNIGWEHKPTFGFGYGFRDAGATFTDWTAEIRFPADNLWSFEEYTLIAGAYKPFANRTAFFGGGLHLQFQKAENGSTLGLAGTVLPTWVYNSDLGDGPGGVLAMRITGMPVLAAKQDGAWKFWPGAYRLEAGGHADLQLERTLGLGLNGAWRRDFQKTAILDDPGEGARPIVGNLTIGSNYYLRRWRFN